MKPSIKNFFELENFLAGKTLTTLELDVFLTQVEIPMSAFDISKKVDLFKHYQHTYETPVDKDGTIHGQDRGLSLITFGKDNDAMEAIEQAQLDYLKVHYPKHYENNMQTYIAQWLANHPKINKSKFETEVSQDRTLRFAKNLLLKKSLQLLKVQKEIDRIGRLEAQELEELSNKYGVSESKAIGNEYASQRENFRLILNPDKIAPVSTLGQEVFDEITKIMMEELNQTEEAYKHQLREYTPKAQAIKLKYEELCRPLLQQFDQLAAEMEDILHKSARLTTKAQIKVIKKYNQVLSNKEGMQL